MLLIDIGSTYTKLTAIDPVSACVVACGAAPTTVEDVTKGFQAAMDCLREKHVDEDLLTERYASSSAAGGLRMVAIGLVPALTMEAAKRAALGAGAKIVGTFSYKLAGSHMEEILALQPDIVLLAGGTNGGEQDTIIHNAKLLAASVLDAPVVMAGNVNAVEKVRELFESAGKYLQVAENVMPEINKLQVDSVKEVIRDIFIRRIVVAKGLDKINAYIKGIALPTPLAVLEGVKTISEVMNVDVVAVDVGGATTDVHSVADGYPRDIRVIQKGLPEPHAKRTVEGDLGVRHNILSIVEEVGRPRFLERAGLNSAEEEARVESVLSRWVAKTSCIAKDDFEKKVDYCLAASAVEIAVNRHCGYIEELWTPDGKIPVQFGKDLTNIGVVIGTGGPLINSECPRDVLAGAVFNPLEPFTLKPKNPGFIIDKRYILYSIGLLRQVDSLLAERVASHYIKEMEV